MKQVPLPKKGMLKEEVLSLLHSFKAGDSDWHQGRPFGLVHYAEQEAEELGLAEKLKGRGWHLHASIGRPVCI
jgi:hypothetical protein